MKKKLFALLLACFLLVGVLVSCGREVSTLEECAEGVIALMDEMVRSEEYFSLYDPLEDYGETLTRLREGDYSKPVAVYELTVSVDELLDVEIDGDALSETLDRYICSSARVSFAPRINSESGIDSVVLSSVFAAQMSFVCKDAEEGKIRLYVFEKGYPIALTFTEGENSTVRVHGNFILNGELITDSEKEIETSLEAMGFADVTVRKR